MNKLIVTCKRVLTLNKHVRRLEATGVEHTVFKVTTYGWRHSKPQEVATNIVQDQWFEIYTGVFYNYQRQTKANVVPERLSIKLQATKPNLGRLLPVGDKFVSMTNRMSKDRYRQSTIDPETREKLNTYEILRPGEIRTLQKGKRKYVCKVLGIVEFSTGLYPGSVSGPYPTLSIVLSGRRWYQFSYLVEIIEN